LAPSSANAAGALNARMTMAIGARIFRLNIGDIPFSGEI
jgi:hypothetical protein